jgi:nucleotide-binding universal stress UspA family protein
MKIICGTDFAPHARSVAKAAIELARRTGGSVELVHVVDPPSAHIQAPSVDVDVLERAIYQSVEEKLAAETQEFARAGEVPVTFNVGAGDVESVLLARAETVGADLIVIGAHGQPALKRLILGSVAERIVRHADRPVLVVPPGADGLGEARDENRALRIMVALDGRRGSEGGVDVVRQLRTRTMCDVTFLRLYWPIEEYRRLGLTGARDLAAPDPAVIADLERTLRMHVGNLPGVGKTSYAVEPSWGDAASGIFLAASQHEADLLIMGAESRHGWARIAHPAVANRVARNTADVPVLFVPAPAPHDMRSEVPKILTVLAPTDLSSAGNRALPFAYALLAAHGGVVELCHVHERSLPNPPYAYDRSEGKLTVEQRTHIEGALLALVPTDAERMGIATHITVIDGGKAAEAIVQAAERFVVDAIALGSHGMGGGTQSLLGSVSRAVLGRARRPVLVLPSYLAGGTDDSERPTAETKAVGEGR